MKEEKTRQEYIAQFYKDILRDIGGEKTIDNLITNLEKITGLKVTDSQRQYIENYVSVSAMKWANVMQVANEGMRDPEILKKIKKKVEKG